MENLDSEIINAATWENERQKSKAGSDGQCRLLSLISRARRTKMHAYDMMMCQLAF